MSRLPSFFRQRGRIKPPKAEHPVQTVDEAIAYFKEHGGVARDPKVGDDGIRYWSLDHDGWSHGGVSDEGLIHIANEHARRRKAA